jgi:hypothetical protein
MATSRNLLRFPFKEIFDFRFFHESVFPNFLSIPSWTCEFFFKLTDKIAALGAPLMSLTLLANLPQVSTTPGVPVAKIAAGVPDTDGNIATGVVDTGSTP